MFPSQNKIILCVQRESAIHTKSRIIKSHPQTLNFDRICLIFIILNKISLGIFFCPISCNCNSPQLATILVAEEIRKVINFKALQKAIVLCRTNKMKKCEK